jgi:uncharacterized protein YecT (DUF1311 family)
MGHRSGVLGWAALAVMTGLLAACSPGGSTPATGTSPTVSTAASTAGPVASASPASAVPSATSSAGSAVQFVPIVEPFDPGHPARQRTAPASCGSQTTTLAIEQCYEIKTENADTAIDAVQLARFEHASKSAQASILAGDSAWLSARQPICAAAFHSGGTIDGINAAICLLAESTARLDAVHEVTPPAAHLKATDSPSTSDIDWYTAPDGTRIGMQASQGDEHGGGIIAWTIIGGPDGFVVAPQQFPFRDGSFTDQGVPVESSAAGHRVATGAEYVFSIDYTQLSKDPNASKGTGTYDYVPGTAPAATWGA